NILQATMLAMQRAVHGLRLKPTLVRIDGNRLPVLPMAAEAIVKGDATVQAIRIIAGGGTIFSPGIAARVMQMFAGRKAAPFPDLTDREREILELIAKGLTNQAIADRLFLSTKTVRNQVSEIYSKLQVASRGEAVAKAKDAGLG
ncbi:MAG: DNA-binding response regulator, partial [Anaerolineales bacterium]|nr:DNA-binding response regulator [Anaerolineales bacterium]